MVNKFEEIDLLFERADEHLEWLRKHVIHPDENLVPEQIGFHIVESSGDRFTGKVRIVIGEFATCLRNALNYATMIVAEQDSKAAVGNTVQFPIDDCEDTFERNAPRYLRGISEEHVAFFKTHQPYAARNRLALLRELTNVYRHRELIAVKKVFQRPERFTTPSDTHTIGQFKVEVRHDFSVAIAFPDGSRIIEALEELRLEVPKIVEEFRPLLKEWLSLHSEF